MSVELFEHYKDALRRGHMALARGQLDVAVAAYREALGLAPDRPLPQIGIGRALLRQGEFALALAAFDAGLARSPRDEGGLQGRADALAGLGRRTDAAEALDVLSEAQEAAGRLTDACDTSRRALDLAEQKARRRRLQELTRRVRLASSDQASGHARTRPHSTVESGDAVARHEAAAPHEAPAPEAAPSTVGAASEAAADGPPSIAQPVDLGAEAAVDEAAVDEAADTVDVTAETDAAEAGAETGAGQTGAAETGAETGAADTVLEEAPVAEPEADEATATAPPQAEERAPAPNPVALVAAAEAALDGGDLDAARRDYLAASTAFAAEGLVAAALDACYVALAFAPDDAELHLRLVELYLDAGWNGPAADKLALLGRLAELDGVESASRARIVGLAADHFPDDPRLRRLSSHAARRDQLPAPSQTA